MSTTAQASSRVRDLLASIALSTVCFLNVWIELSSTEHDYFRKVAPSLSMGVAAVLLTVLGAALIFASIRLARRSVLFHRIVGYMGLFAACLIGANVLRTSLTTGWSSSAAQVRFLVALLALGALAVVFAIRQRKAVVEVIASFLLIGWPLFPILLVQAIWTHTQRDLSSFADAGPRPVSASGSRRILWMIFDEWDYRLVQPARPSDLKLPVLDSLAKEAMVASHAVGGGPRTANVVPSVLIDRRVVESRTGGPKELFVRIEGAEPVADSKMLPLSSQRSLFSDFRQLGKTSSVVGWYHPYCRVFGPQIDTCVWEPGASIYDRLEYRDDLDLSGSVGMLVERQLLRVPFLGRFDFARRENAKRSLQLVEFNEVRRHARSALGSADLVYVHWPIPHPYGIYDRQRKVTSTDASSNYIDNLSLVDSVIGEFRSALEARGEWDRTTVILSSDHSLRIGEWFGTRAWSEQEERATGNRPSPYVPVIVKLAGQNEPVRYDQPFSILLLHDLVLALGRDEIRSTESLGVWLDQNRHKFSPPLASPSR